MHKCANRVHRGEAMTVRKERRQRKDGTFEDAWFVDVKFKRVNERSVRVRRRSPLQSKRGAEAFERQIREQLVKNDGKLDTEVAPKDIPTLQAFWPEFEAWVAVNNKPSEQKGKRIVFNNHLLPHFGKKKLDAIGPRELENFKAEKVKQEYKPATINNFLTTLRKCLDVAVDYGVLKHVP